MATGMGGQPAVWYRVRDFAAGKAFFTETLGFDEADCDEQRAWALLRHGNMEVELTEGEPDLAGGVASIVVADVKAEAARLRSEHVQVGTVLELHGQVRLLDVFDRDGNRIQLTQDL